MIGRISGPGALSSAPALRGGRGENGKNPVLRYENGVLEWRLEGEQEWKSLCSLKDFAWSVSAFAGRTGAVTPQRGDYSADMVGAYTTAQTDALLAAVAGRTGVSRTNLLLNGDFRTPVNQRGRSEWANYGFTVDRWCFSPGQPGSARLSAAGMELTTGDTNVLSTLTQTLEWCNPRAGRYTLSAQVLSGAGSIQLRDGNMTLLATCIFNGPGVYVATGTLGAGVSPVVQMRASGNGSCVIERVKLERGETSTLETDDPSDPATELARCQRYCVNLNRCYSCWNAMGLAFAGSATAATVLVPLPVNLRDMPVVSFEGAYYLQDAAGSPVACTGVSVDQMSGNGVQLTVTAAGGLTPGKVYLLRRYNAANSKLNFLLSADI